MNFRKYELDAMVSDVLKRMRAIRDEREKETGKRIRIPYDWEIRNALILASDDTGKFEKLITKVIEKFTNGNT